MPEGRVDTPTSQATQTRPVQRPPVPPVSGPAMHERRRALLEEALSARALTRDAISRALAIDDGDIAFVTGSVLDGVGDSQSDLDVYVLTSQEGFARRSADFDDERRAQQERQGFGILYCEVGGHTLDAECHRTEKFAELFDELALLQPLDRGNLWRSFRGLGRFERGEAIELLHRFRVGVPIHAEARHEALRETFDEWKFLAWNAHLHIIEAEDFLKGVKRSLGEHDEENAHLKLLRLYDSLADAKLFASGESLDRWKWRLPKLRKLGDSEFLALYLSVQLGGGERSTLRERVSAQLERARSIHQGLREQLRVPG